MNSNTELLLNSVKSNLTGNRENDIAYLSSVAEKYSGNRELREKLEEMQSSVINEDGYHKSIDYSQSADDTSAEDGVIQNTAKKVRTRASRQIRDIRELFNKGTINAEMMLVSYEFPKLQNLYETTTVVAEKEEICRFARYAHNGLTALHLSCYYEEFEMVKFFVSLGADVNARFGVYDVTPLDHLLYDNKPESSSEENRRQIEMFLIDNGARRGFSLKRNLRLLILTFPAAIAFLITSIFSLFFLIPAFVFILLTVFLAVDCRVYKAKKKSTAILFAVLGGGIGLHKFYLNNIPAGFKHFLVSFFSFFIGGIIWGYTDISKIKNGTLLDAAALELIN